jgi:hypothetical protein
LSVSRSTDQQGNLFSSKVSLKLETHFINYHAFKESHNCSAFSSLLVLARRLWLPCVRARSPAYFIRLNRCRSAKTEMVWSDNEAVAKPSFCILEQTCRSGRDAWRSVSMTSLQVRADQSATQPECCCYTNKYYSFVSIFLSTSRETTGQLQQRDDR